MVGDNLQADILGAQNAGCHHIWLTAQADTPSNREHVSIIVPEATAERLTDVPAVLREFGAFPLGG
jgi:FMN phosphatase YigB (HAD superfamily)